jgi:hypothetical protein
LAMSTDEQSRPISVQTTTRRTAKSLVVVLAIAKKEGRDNLTDPQYVHVTDIIKRLVYFNDPDEMSDMPIRSVEDFYELRLKGNALGRKNLRVFFGYFADRREIVVVRAWQKDNEDQTPTHIKTNVKTRLRKYLAGELRENLTIYTGDSD